MSHYLQKLFWSLLLTALCISAADARQDTIREFIHYGPMEVRKPFMADTADVNSKKFDINNMLPELLPVSVFSGKGVEIKADSAGRVLLTADSTKHYTGLLTFYIDASRFCMAGIRINGGNGTEVYLNGVRQRALNKLMLDPRRHKVNIKYMTRLADTCRLSVMLDCETQGALSYTLDPTKTFTINSVLEGRRINGASLSHDGKYLLTNYYETFAGGRRITYAILTDRAKGNQVRIEGKTLHWMPRSPKLYYTRVGASGVELVTIEPATLREEVIAQGLPSASSLLLSPNETFIIYANSDQGPKEEGSLKQVLSNGDRQPGWRNRSFIFKYDLATGLSERLTFGNVSTSLRDMTEDGRYLLFSMFEYNYDEPPFSINSFFRMDLQTLAVDTLFLHDRAIEGAAFSPDGSKLVIFGSANAFDGLGLNLPKDMIANSYDKQLFIYDIATKEARPMTKYFDPSVESYEWNTYDGKIYFRAENRDKMSLYVMDPSSGAITDLKVSEDVVQAFSLSKKSPELVYYGQSINNLHRLYTVDLRRGKETLVDDVSAELLRGIELGEAGDWNFKSKNGDTIYGRYYYPPQFDPGRVYPMIVYYYGGTNPTARRMDTGYSPDVFAALGFVVYVIQPSGATGFGQEFSARHVNAWGKKTADEIIEGTTKFCDEHTFVDRSKIGCVGASYGGFMTMYLQTVTDIFAAAISHAGISNISAYWGEGFWGTSYSSIASAGSYPWNAEWLYAGQSPLFNADKVNTPILFLHGTVDTNVPTNQSIQMFVALKTLGKETALVTVEGENHGITQYDNRIKWSNTMYAWFCKWLKGQPEWWESMYPKRNVE